MKMLFPEGKQKALTLSYDDGVVQDRRLVGILDAHGIKSTFNINASLYYKGDRDPARGRMTKPSTLALFKDSGHEVAIHGYTHPHLERLDASEVIREITEDRRQLEADFGTIIRGMAYPYGTYNDTVLRALELCGVAYSRTVQSTRKFEIPENWLTLHPTCHHNDPRLMELARKFVDDPSRWGDAQMFYLWGHSYEFDDNDNWNVIEEFCAYMGGREDIWYATNIEIYNYTQAYRSLQTSYDKTVIYNPSVIDVWVVINNQTYCVKAGQTLSI